MRLYLAVVFGASLVLLMGCNKTTGFKKAFGIDVPVGIEIVNEKYFKRWDMETCVYIAVLKGNHDAFLDCIHHLNLERTTNAAQIVAFVPIASSEASWWNPPNLPMQENSKNNYGRRSEQPMYPFSELAAATYTNGIIYLYKWGRAGYSGSKTGVGRE